MEYSAIGLIGSPLTISVSEGIDVAIGAVAAVADPRQRFLSHGWFAAAVRRLHLRGRVWSLIGRRADGKAVIALPLLRRRGGITGVPGCYWPHRAFPVAADLTDAELEQFLRARRVRRMLGFLWRLGPVYADDPALVRLRRVASDAGWTVIERRIATSFLFDIAAARADGAWPRGSTLRKNRFHEKHLGEHGALEWRFVRGADWTPERFDDLAAIEARSWVGHTRGTDGKFIAPRMRAFWEELARDPAQADRMSAAILYVGGEPAAFSFDLDIDEFRYAIANSYDPAFSRHSPGKCLYYRNLVEAAGRGVRLVDWGAGDSGYKEVIGASPAADIVDCLILRGRAGRWVAQAAGWWWKRSGRA